MADISKIVLPNDETQYNVKDAQARNSISLLENHIIFSKTQPAAGTQVAGDIWVILTGSQQEE